ncbi:MAG: O-linked N-acetylglucosamine transferase [Azospirillaceae bacterium]|nr:O-linked N-acetylglucosamine transferase [Azospirillaceae bacterium]
MVGDILAPALIRSMARDFSVIDLIHTAETMKQSGQSNSVAALYETWIQHNQENPLLYAVLFNYSVILSDSGNLTLAREQLDRAIALNPDFMPAHINLGRIYERLGTVGPAIVQWSAVLGRLAAVNGAAITHKTTALNQIARTLEAAGQDESAEDMLRQSLEIDCHQREVVQHYLALRQRQCEWPVAAPLERVPLDRLMIGMSPLSVAAYTDDPLFQLAVAWNYNMTDVGTPATALSAWPQASQRMAPLRVGYLSSDLREHAVGHLMAEVFGLHDRNAVEVFAYYCGPVAQDALHDQFRATVDHWTSIAELDDAAAARRIADDQIQILIDLNGYTREARTKVIAYRPAPVIVNWLGFPGTMASPYHHYIIADDWIIPPGDEMYYAETVLQLPCYQPNNRKRIVASRRPTRSEAGLPETDTVFCCFNGAHKITRFTFERWLMILNGVPGSVLWLLSNTEATNDRLKRLAAERGIAPERLVFAEKLANPYHLARYVLADLFLDTCPYGAHTTASDALWMGVPVLTLNGRSFASRVCGSLVRAAGVPEMVCDTAADYVSRAIALGNDREAIRPLRDRLVAGREDCVLFDMPRLVRHLEALYATMWRNFKAGTLPRPDLSNLDVYLEVGRQVHHDEVEVQTIADYRGWWQERLARRDAFRPINPDHRAWPGVPSAASASQARAAGDR